MSNGNAEPKAWTLSTTIMAGMGALIILALATIGSLASMGLSSLKEQIASGDAIIHKKIDEGNRTTQERLNDVCKQLGATNEIIMKHQADISRIDAYQKMRLDRENRGK